MNRLMTLVTVAAFAALVGCSSGGGDAKPEDKPADTKPADTAPADPAKLAEEEPVTEENVDKVVDALEKQLEAELAAEN